MQYLSVRFRAVSRQIRDSQLLQSRCRLGYPRSVTVPSFQTCMEMIFKSHKSPIGWELGNMQNSTNARSHVGKRCVQRSGRGSLFSPVIRKAWWPERRRGDIKKSAFSRKDVLSFSSEGATRNRRPHKVYMIDDAIWSLWQVDDT